MKGKYTVVVLVYRTEIGGPAMAVTTIPGFTYLDEANKAAEKIKEDLGNEYDACETSVIEVK